MNGQKTVSEERERIRANREKGTTCECCGQLVKIYQRKLSSSMAYGLIALVRAYRESGDWTHITNIPIQDRRVWSAVRGDFAKLRYWGLIVAKENDDDAKRSSGYWKPTERGVSFVAGKLHVPHSFGLLNGEPVSVAQNTIDIRQALTDRYNYSELIEGIPGLFPDRDQMTLELG